MDLVELRPHLYRLWLGRFQAYLWRDEDSAVLIDTGEVGSGPAIGELLGRIGMSVSDLDAVVLTHFHDDHAGSAAELVAGSGATVVAHESDAPIIRGERPGPEPNFTDAERALHAQVAAGIAPAPPVRVDREVRDGDMLDFAGGAQVIGTPGHTDGSIAVYLPRHRVLFTGDIAAEHGGQVMLGVFNLDRTVTARSFARLADLEVDTVCFGHGDPIVGDASARLRPVAAALRD